jgi:hypothetical protein
MHEHTRRHYIPSVFLFFLVLAVITCEKDYNATTSKPKRKRGTSQGSFMFLVPASKNASYFRF